MYIADFLKQREGKQWTEADSAEVMRIVAEIEKTALAMRAAVTAKAEPGNRK